MAEQPCSLRVSFGAASAAPSLKALTVLCTVRSWTSSGHLWAGGACSGLLLRHVFSICRVHDKEIDRMDCADAFLEPISVDVTAYV